MVVEVPKVMEGGGGGWMSFLNYLDPASQLSASLILVTSLADVFSSCYLASGW